MERCPNCGNKLSNIDVLCPRCGTVVEVIQIKNNIASDATKSIAAADNKDGKKDSPQKKDFPQSFIVYNEDFPAEDESRETTEAASAVPASEEESFDAEFPKSREAFLDGNAPPINGVDAAAGQSILDRYKQQLGESEATAGEHISGGAGEENDNDYSPRYLENIMNMDLPEIDDLQNFDPDEFMKEYRRSKSTSGSGGTGAPVKHWLELEEAGPADMDGQAAAEPIMGRRYRGTPARTKEPKTEPKTESRTAPGIEEAREESSAKPVKLKPKKSNAMLSVLLWVLVTAAFFFSFIFFDKYVQRAYGTYDNLIYSITNGKVDLGPHN